MMPSKLTIVKVICTLAAATGAGMAWQAVTATATPQLPTTIIVDVSGRTKTAIPKSPRTGVFMTYGQSNSVNSGVIGYVASDKVGNFFNGQTYHYEDPALGGDMAKGAAGGSVWGRVGDQLIAKGDYQHVVFGLAGIGGASMASLRQGEIYAEFVKRYKEMKETFGRVDAILFHQGESDNSAMSDSDYKREFAKFKTSLKSDGVDAPFVLSRVSYCYGMFDEKLIATQNEIIRENDDIYAGPNTDLLSGPTYRREDDCHFTHDGLDMFAVQWVEALDASGLVANIPQ